MYLTKSIQTLWGYLYLYIHVSACTVCVCYLPLTRANHPKATEVNVLYVCVCEFFVFLAECLCEYTNVHLWRIIYLLLLLLLLFSMEDLYLRVVRRTDARAHAHGRVNRGWPTGGDGGRGA